MRRFHCVLTGPPGSGKSTLSQLLSEHFNCPSFDTLRFHTKTSSFSQESAAEALEKYLNNLRSTLITSSMVISEGIFIREDRRQAVWRATVDANARLLPITLCVSEAEMLRRIKSKAPEGNPQIEAKVARAFLAEFASKPWGRVVDTTDHSIKSLLNHLLRLLNLSMDSGGKLLLLYYDNTGWENILDTVDRISPLPITTHFLNVAQAIDGLVWADVITYLEYPADEVYRNTAQKIESTFPPVGLAELLLPCSVDESEVVSLCQIALQALVYHLQLCNTSGSLNEAIQGSLESGAPAAVTKDIVALKRVLANIADDHCSAELPLNLRALTWFINALLSLPQDFEKLKKLLSTCTVNREEAWLAAHRLFRCFFHLYSSKARGAIYWPTVRRSQIIQYGMRNPVRIFNQATLGANPNVRSIVGPTITDVNFSLPFFGAYILLRFGSRIMTKSLLSEEIMNLKDADDVSEIRRLVREFYAVIDAGEKSVDTANKLLLEIRSIGNSIRSLLGSGTIPLSSRQLGVEIPASLGSQPILPPPVLAKGANRLAWLLLNIDVQPNLLAGGKHGISIPPDS